MSFFTYEHLRVIWWLLLGVLLIGFAIIDGFDLGTAILLPFVGKTTASAASSSTPSGRCGKATRFGSFSARGAIFAAWPLIYAVSFSGFYLAMLLVLWALILRPGGFKYAASSKARAGARPGTGCSSSAGSSPR